MKYCAKCGNKLANEDIFCNVCGHKVINTDQNSNTDQQNFSLNNQNITKQEKQKGESTSRVCGTIALIFSIISFFPFWCTTFNFIMVITGIGTDFLNSILVPAIALSLLLILSSIVLSIISLVVSKKYKVRSIVSLIFSTLALLNAILMPFLNIALRNISSTWIM